MIEAPDFLPLGSIVTLEGNDVKKLMVIGRAIAVHPVEGDEAVEYYDYALVMYPEGILGDSIIYSNHDCITEIFHRGFSDEENTLFAGKLAEILTQVEGIPKAEPRRKDLW